MTMPVFLRDLTRHGSSLLGGVLIGVLILMAVLAPVVAPYSPDERRSGEERLAPGSAHLLGSDELGRDLLSRLLYGARLSLLVGVVSVGIAVTLGLSVGLVSGYAGGGWDLVLMRVMDMMLAFPSILLAIVIVAILGPSLGNAMLSVGLVAVPSYARLTRASVLQEKERDYVSAARSLGASHGRIVMKAILPNILAPLIVQCTLGFATAILDAAGLSFLGLGAQPPQIEWGLMLKSGKDLVLIAWWLVTFPGLLILLSVLGFNLLGDGLRDVLDPRLKRR
ncbi:MAG: ABC transporter permease [Acidobacteriota bacterium]